MKKKVLLVSLALLLVTSLVASSHQALASPPVKHKKVKLKMWCAWPVTKFPSSPLNGIFRDLVNENGKAVNLSIQMIGGPEVFGTYEGIQAQLAGTLDVAYTSPAYYLGVVPESLAVMLNQYTPWESRDRGTFGVVDKLHQRKGLKYLAWTGYPVHFQVYSRFDTPRPDLTGKLIRTGPIYDPLVRKLGGTPVNVAPPEVYEALARGMVNGIVWPNLGIADYGWHEHLKYYWGQPLPYVSDGSWTMNLDAFKRLDKDQQAVLVEAGKKLERVVVKHPGWGGRVEKDYRKLVIEGPMKHIKFSEADYKFYVDTAVDVVWEQVIGKAPDAGQLRPLMSK
jgi:TRAP-type C4-dicarboxylate transport system substrate-binding protein